MTEKIYFISDDGKKFSKEQECLDHEKKLKVAKELGVPYSDLAWFFKNTEKVRKVLRKYF